MTLVPRKKAPQSLEVITIKELLLIAHDAGVMVIMRIPGSIGEQVILSFGSLKFVTEKLNNRNTEANPIFCVIHRNVDGMDTVIGLRWIGTLDECSDYVEKYPV